MNRIHHLLMTAGALTCALGIAGCSDNRAHLEQSEQALEEMPEPVADAVGPHPNADLTERVIPEWNEADGGEDIADGVP